MRLLNRFINIIVLLFLGCSLTFLSPAGLLTHAQESSPFEIRITPQAEYVVSGQPLTYSIAITNISLQSWPSIMVKVRIPTGSVFVESYFVNPKWFVGGIQPGQSGEIIWLTQDPIAPNEAMTFSLVVKVLPELVGQQLINDEYSVMTLDNNQILASGPPLKTQVLIPTPITLPPIEPTDTRFPTATSFLSTPLVSPDLAVLTSSPLTASIPTSQAGNLAVNRSITSIQSTTSDVSFINMGIIVSIPGLILLIAGLMWFWKYKFEPPY